VRVYVENQHTSWMEYDQASFISNVPEYLQCMKFSRPHDIFHLQIRNNAWKLLNHLDISQQSSAMELHNILTTYIENDLLSLIRRGDDARDEYNGHINQNEISTSYPTFWYELFWKQNNHKKISNDNNSLFINKHLLIVLEKLLDSINKKIDDYDSIGMPHEKIGRLIHDTFSYYTNMILVHHLTNEMLSTTLMTRNIFQYTQMYNHRISESEKKIIVNNVENTCKTQFYTLFPMETCRWIKNKLNKRIQIFKNISNGLKDTYMQYVSDSNTLRNQETMFNSKSTIKMSHKNETNNIKNLEFWNSMNKKKRFHFMKCAILEEAIEHRSESSKILNLHTYDNYVHDIIWLYDFRMYYNNINIKQENIYRKLKFVNELHDHVNDVVDNVRTHIMELNMYKRYMEELINTYIGWNAWFDGQLETIIFPPGLLVSPVNYEIPKDNFLLLHDIENILNPMDLRNRLLNIMNEILQYKQMETSKLMIMNVERSIDNYHELKNDVYHYGTSGVVIAHEMFHLLSYVARKTIELNNSKYKKMNENQKRFYVYHDIFDCIFNNQVGNDWNELFYKYIHISKESGITKDDIHDRALSWMDENYADHFGTYLSFSTFQLDVIKRKNDIITSISIAMESTLISNDRKLIIMKDINHWMNLTNTWFQRVFIYSFQNLWCQNTPSSIASGNHGPLRWNELLKLVKIDKLSGSAAALEFQMNSFDPHPISEYRCNQPSNHILNVENIFSCYGKNNNLSFQQWQRESSKTCLSLKK
jgi:hypothetical protein